MLFSKKMFLNTIVALIHLLVVFGVKSNRQLVSFKLSKECNFTELNLVSTASKLALGFPSMALAL